MPVNDALTAVIACAVLEEEVRYFARESPGLALHFLPQGLHATPNLLREKLRELVSEIEATRPVDTIVLVYGLCSRGVETVTTTRARLVIPRAHDCITLLLGSRHRYAQYVRENPGTYWYSPGWNRHHVPPGEERYQKALADYRARFSEEDAQFLMESEQAWFAAYQRATFVDLGATDTGNDIAYTRRCADWLGWSFDRQQGDPELLRTLLAGPWDPERFLVLQPGQSARMTADDRVMEPVALTVNGHSVAPAVASPAATGGGGAEASP